MSLLDRWAPGLDTRDAAEGCGHSCAVAVRNGARNTKPLLERFRDRRRAEVSHAETRRQGRRVGDVDQVHVLASFRWIAAEPGSAGGVRRVDRSLACGQ